MPADQVGARTEVLMPLFHRLQAHLVAAERLHGDDTALPVLARGNRVARLWTYVRGEWPFRRARAPGGRAPMLARSRGANTRTATWQDTA